MGIDLETLIILAVLAFILFGPEKLPRVARTVGALMGRAQRYVNDVKADINGEIQLDELKKLQQQVADQAKGMEQSVTEQLKATETSLNESIASAAESKAADLPAELPAPAAGPETNELPPKA